MKQITFNTNPSDIRFILKTLVARIMKREQKAKEEALQGIDEYINESQCDEILESLQQLLSAQAQSAIELSELGVLVDLIRSANTEVLKDLPDL